MQKLYIVPVIKTVTGYLTVKANNKDEALKLFNSMQTADDNMEITDSSLDLLVDEIECIDERG